MSNPDTHYITFNQTTSLYQDLSGIFQPYSGGTKTPVTYFNVNGHGDLNNIFDPSTNGEIITYDTGYSANGVDLRYYFAKYAPKIILNVNSFSGSYTTGTNGSISWYKFVVLSDLTSSGSISFSAPGLSLFDINLCIIGGGDCGGGSNYGAGGGGGGIYYQENVTINIGTNYSIQVGQNGKNDVSSPYNRLQSPSDSYFDTYTATAASQSTGGSGNYNGGNGGVGNSGTGSGQNGFDSGFTTFSGPDTLTYTLGGGGGSAVNEGRPGYYGGNAGNGTGGQAGGQTNNINGQNASVNSNNIGGGGGGSEPPQGPTVSGGKGGDGNPGAIFLWWTTYQ